VAKTTRDAKHIRRLLALAEIYDGGSGSAPLSCNRSATVSFNAKGVDGLVNGKAPGADAEAHSAQRSALAPMIESSPDHGHPWGGALAADRSGAVAMGGVPHQGGQADRTPIG
jgi:hypothetical protein